MKWTTAILGLTLATACATSPTGRKQLILVPDDQMDQMGAQAFQEIDKETPVTKNQQATAYVNCIAKNITAVLPKEFQGQWDVKVFESDQVNAFALPGKKIGVYTGLLKVATNQDQVATVMGHEVGHVLARHGNERVSQNVVLQQGMTVLDAFNGSGSTQKSLIMGALGLGAQYGIVLPHSRTQESEADRIGLELMAQAGFNPQQSVELWKNMSKAAGGQEPPQWASTHPGNQTRITGLQKDMAAAQAEEAKAKAAGRNPQCGSAGL